MPFEQVERHPRQVSADALVSYQANRYSVPFSLVGHTVTIQDDRNGQLRIYHGDKEVAQHAKATRRQQVMTHAQHYEGIRKVGSQKGPQPLPQLVPEPAPEVTERALAVYDQLANEEGQL